MCLCVRLLWLSRLLLQQEICDVLWLLLKYALKQSSCRLQAESCKIVLLRWFFEMRWWVWNSRHWIELIVWCIYLCRDTKNRSMLVRQLRFLCGNYKLLALSFFWLHFCLSSVYSNCSLSRNIYAWHEKKKITHWSKHLSFLIFLRHCRGWYSVVLSLSNSDIIQSGQMCIIKYM